MAFDTHVRFRPADFERVRRAAEASGESVAAFCRRGAVRLARLERLDAEAEAVVVQRAVDAPCE